MLLLLFRQRKTNLKTQVFLLPWVFLLLSPAKGHRKWDSVSEVVINNKISFWWCLVPLICVVVRFVEQGDITEEPLVYSVAGKCRSGALVPLHTIFLLLCKGAIKGFIRQAWVHYRCCVSRSLLDLDKPHSDQGHIPPAVAPSPHRIDFGTKVTVLP